ncbi:MAG: hypothetical protein MJ250_01620 [Alphaproteobacteria bacterium]|nr:hypothetical protein [Alphaproteobacteria bacterium]
MWIFYTILTSWINCAYFFGNQISKITPNVFMFYRGIIPALILSLFLPWVNFITSWQFYLACVFQGIIVSFIDYRQFRAIRIWGAERVSSIYPFCLGFVFIFWLILKPSDIAKYSEDPLRMIGIIGSLIGIFFSVFSYSKSNKNKQALQYLFPLILASALCDAMNKFCMSYTAKDDLISGSILYIIIQSTIIAIVNLVLYKKNNGQVSDFYKWKNVKYSPIIILNILAGIFKNFAMYNTPNPSYVTALLYLSIIWIMLIAYILTHFGIKCRHNDLPPYKVLLLVISTVALAILG